MRFKAAALVTLCLMFSCLTSQAQQPKPRTASTALNDRIRGPIDDQERAVINGQRHPLARPEYEIGRVPADARVERIVLVLRPTAAQQVELEDLIRAQQDPQSPLYHHWVAPSEFGERFGISWHDLEQVSAWLQSHEMDVEPPPPSRSAIVFSGAAGKIEKMLHTSLRQYVVGSEHHFANATELEIPRALVGVVGGVVSLHDFRSAPQLAASAPAFTAGNGAHYLMPADWNTIYNVAPLYTQGLDGSGQSIAVLGRVDIRMDDVRTFRSNAGLLPNDPEIIVNGPDPGFPDCNDEVESALDVEWAGAVASNANVKFVTSKSGSTDGIGLSALYAVNNNVAPVLSLSYGLCEGAYGSSGNTFWNSLWAQAAAQGISVFVSSGDSGAAGCDSPSLRTATRGRGVNALCSSPYSTCVGGTQFDDVYHPDLYWSQTNGASLGSALSYIPEVAWNESGWSGGLWSTGGGASQVYSKPAWQAAPGVPADGHRDVPDVSMTSAIHDAYVIQVQGQTFLVAGTSAATPSFAGVVALLVQNSGAIGNVNPDLYTLANLQLASNGAHVFHDITTGTNSVPGVTGYSTGTGYDLATGLGSVDAAELVNHWSDAGASTFTLIPSALTPTAARGGTASLTLAMTAQGGFNSPVALSVSGLPTGVIAAFSAATLTPSTTVRMTLTATSGAAAGTYPLLIAATGGGRSQTVSVSLTVTVPDFTLTAGASSATLPASGATSLTVTTSGTGGFKSTIALSMTGLPRGVTAGFAPASIAAPGSGSSILTLRAASTVVQGSYTITISATGGGVTRTRSLALTLIVPSFALNLGTSGVAVAKGGSTTLTITTSGNNGFNSPIALAVIGLPRGVSATLSPATISAPGDGSSALTLRATTTAVPGTYTLTVRGTGGGLTRTQTVSLTVTNGARR